MLKLTTSHPGTNCLLSFILLLLCSSHLSAQIPKLMSKMFSIEDGLPADPIYSITQDHLGYVWMGTSFGLSRYDGYEFQNYVTDLTDSTGLQGHKISCILETEDGNLWLGSDQGLHFFDRGREQFQNIIVDSAGLEVHYIFEDKRGFIWAVGGSQSHLFLWDPGSGRLVQVFKNQGDAPIRVGKFPATKTAPIQEGPEGKVWVGTFGQGVFAYDPTNDALASTIWSEHLPGDTIYSLLLHDQQLWIGTSSGLARYDLKSQRVLPFPKGDPANGEAVFDIRKDSEGKLWLQQPFKVTRINPADESFEVKLRLQPLNSKRAGNLRGRDFFIRVGEDAEGHQYWVHPLNHDQFFQYRPKQDTILAINYDFPEKGGQWNYQIPFSRYESGMVDHTGILWLGFGGGVVQLQPNQKQFFTHSIPIKEAPNGVEEFNQDSWGNIWFSTAQASNLYKFNPENQQLVSIQGQAQNIFLNAGHWSNLLIDHKDNLWWGLVPAAGLYRSPLEPSSFLNLAFKKPASASSIEYRIMLVSGSAVDGDPLTRWGSDFYDEQWWEVDLESIHDIDRLVILWNPSFAAAYSVQLSDDREKWRTVFSTKNGKGQIERIPIGKRGRYLRLALEKRNTNYGFSIREVEIWSSPPEITSYHNRPPALTGLPSGVIYDLAEDAGGVQWIATHKGIVRYDEKRGRFELILGPDGKPLVKYRPKILGDSKGFVWIFSFDAIYYVPPGSRVAERFEPREEANFQATNFSNVFEDGQGDLWFFDQANGLYRYHRREKTGTFYLPELKINTVFEDHARRIWLGSLDQGLFLFDPATGKYLQYNIDAGLAARQVNAISEDQQGRLWIATNGGLSCFYPAEERFENYGEQEGLFGQRVRHLFKDAKGRFALGGWGGFSFFDPQEFHADSTRAKMVIDELRIRYQVAQPGVDGASLSKAISKTEAITLAHHQNVLSLKYSALHFQNPNKNQYRVMLEGLDSSWVEMSNQRVANYTGLSPGTYTFKVKGSNADGVWTEKSASLQITILEPWYWSWWSRLIYMLAFGIGVLGFIQWRTRSLRHRQAQLEQTIINRTEEVRAEKRRSDELLLNILPSKVAEELKEKGKTLPVYFENVSVLFTDFSGYTNIVASMPGIVIVQELDDIFRAFDDIMESVGLEKIQTIGDAYLAVSGLPNPDPHHAQKCVLAGQQIIDFLDKRNLTNSIKWKVRIGIHSGALTAGVIGKKKFSYDIFGDTVNIAARIESAGAAGKINVSANTHRLIHPYFLCTYRGKIDAKGKGELDMYFVE